MASQFTWSTQKAASNVTKHGIHFEDATRVFLDPLALFETERVDQGEQRWKAIGKVTDHLLLVVIHVIRDDEGEEVIRIISARRVEPKEKRQYEGQHG